MCSTSARLALIAAGVLLAGGMSGYLPDYDYGLGDDWYGRTGPRDPDRDYPAFAIDLFSAGDDYGFGYTQVTRVLDLRTPLPLTRTKRYEYHFRYNTLLGCPTEDPECSDGVWCNGQEYCGFDGCQAVPSPCDDFDPCTQDNCNEGTRGCSNPPVPPPTDPTALTLARSGGNPAIASLAWSNVASAEHYNVYRGNDPALGDLTCFADHVMATTLDDDGSIPVELYVYLTSAFACSQESTLGEDSGGTTRSNSAPCP